MKKIFLLCIACLLCTNTFAQFDFDTDWYHIEPSIVVRGGYNVAEKQPIGSLVAYIQTGFVRVQLETGISDLQPIKDMQKHVFGYLAPSVGIIYGSRHIAYALVGATTWPVLEKSFSEVIFKNDVWHCKVDLGLDIRLNDRLFANINMVCMLPRKDTAETTHLKNLGLSAGLGVHF